MSRPALRVLNFLSPCFLPVYAAIMRFGARRLGLSVEIADGVTYEQFDTDEFDLALICSVPYVRFTDQTPGSVVPLAAPVLSAARYQRRPIYFSDVIVRANSRFETFDDLAGAHWCYNEPFSHSGSNVVRAALMDRGVGDGFFSKVTESGFHHRSVGMVVEGAVDASSIDSHVLDYILRTNPDIAAQIRTVETLGPSTIQPLVARPSLEASLRQELADALFGVTVDDVPELTGGGIARFVPIDDSDYDDIRAMLRRAENAPLLARNAPPWPKIVSA